MENHIKLHDLGVPLFLETPTWVKFSHFFLDDGIIWEAYELHRSKIASGTKLPVMALLTPTRKKGWA